MLTRTAALVAIPSVSHTEAALADHVESQLRARPDLRVDRIGANVVARTELGRPERVVLAGHLDTVPANGNASPSMSDEGDPMSISSSGGKTSAPELDDEIPF